MRARPGPPRFCFVNPRRYLVDQVLCRLLADRYMELLPFRSSVVTVVTLNSQSGQSLWSSVGRRAALQRKSNDVGCP